MSSKFKTPRGGKPTATSINTSQRNSCEVVIYRFDQSDIMKLEKLNVASDKGLAGAGSAGTKENFTPRGRMTIRNDIIRCSITKNKGSSSGTFSLTLKRGKRVRNGVVQPEDIDYLDAINAGDWILIYMKKSGQTNTTSIKDDSGLKFMGVIENVRYVEVDQPDKGSPRLEYVVTGRDFGKVFENEVFFNPVLNDQTIQTILGAKFLTDSTKSVRGDNRAVTTNFTPDKVIKNLVSFYLGGAVDSLNVTHQLWYVPADLARSFRPQVRVKSGGVSFVDILDTSKIGLHQYDRNNKFRSVNPLPGAALIKALPASGSVWAILQFMQNAAVNEMYTELVRDSRGNLQPTLVMRQFPFSNYNTAETNSFKANSRLPSSGGKGTVLSDNISDSEKTYFVTLPQTTIVSSDIKQKNVGKSDHERINHAIIVPKIDDKTNDILYSVAYNVPSIQRYGLRSIQTQSSYVLRKGEGIKKTLDRYLNLLIDWFFLAHNLFNGTIITDGRDEHVEIGTNLYITDVKQLYHIEGYTHNYELRADGKTMYTTEFRVSRGQVWDQQRRKSNFIGPSTARKEPTTITSSSLEGFRNGGRR